MDLQVLVSAMNQEPRKLADQMNLSSDAIIINQCGSFGYEEVKRGGKTIRFFSFAERGVGLSRNNALLRADHEISLFSDDDIVYENGYEEKVLEEFRLHPEADMILFQFRVNEERRTYEDKEWKRIRLHNCGRYPTFSFALRTEKLHGRNITYSLLFGGGAKYSNGEDSLFIKECIQKGMRVYASPVTLGREEATPSTWFAGYTEKFFVDRGVLYRHLYGPAALPLAVRFLWKHKKKMCRDIACKEALAMMRRGIREAGRGL